MNSPNSDARYNENMINRKIASKSVNNWANNMKSNLKNELLDLQGSNYYVHP